MEVVQPGGSLKVLIVTSRLDIGGTERHLARILPALQRRGINIGLYVMERGGPLEAELLAQGVGIYGPRRMRVLHWARASLKLAGFLRRERPTVVHFFLPRPYIYGSIAAEIAGHRRRLMSRRSLTNYRDKYPLLREVENFLHRRTVGIIGNSQAVLDQLALEVSDPSKLALIHNGVELPDSMPASERQKIRRELQIDEHQLLIAVVANLVAYKGHRDFIEALAAARDKLPRSWRVLAIGRDEGLGAELKDKAKGHGLSDHILWLGERSDANTMLASSDIFVLPSHQEGFSNALLEAMAVNVPAVATAVGGNLDAIVNDVTGLLVPPADPPALAAALVRLANDVQLRSRFAEAARQRVQQRFTLEACVVRYERLYRAMADHSPAPVREILFDEDNDRRACRLEARPEHAR